MPTIYNPLQVQSSGLRPIGGAGDQAVRTGQNLMAQAEKMKQENIESRFLIDASEFEIDRIEAMEQIEQGSRYDAASGITYVGDAPVEGSLTEHSMRMFNERISSIEKTYGQKGVEWAAQKRVQAFSQVTQVDSRIKQAGNLDQYEKFVNYSAAGIEQGTSSFSEAVAMSDEALSRMSMSPEARQRSMEYSRNYLTEAMFNRDMKNQTSVAIQRVNSKFYDSLAPGMGDKFSAKVDSYINAEAMKEASAAMEAAAYGMKHTPNKAIVGYAKERGLYEVSAALEAAQSQADIIHAYTTGSLPVAASEAGRMANDALLKQDPKQLRFAHNLQKAITNKTNMVVNSPRSALLTAGVVTDEDDYSDPAQLVENRRRISEQTKKQFSIEPNFLGESAPVLSEIVSKSPAGDRFSIISSYSSYMTDSEKSRSTVEMRDLNPRIGVAMTLPPSQRELGNQVLAEVDQAYMPKDTKFSPVVAKVDAGLEWGDVAAKNAVIESAKNVYAYRAKINQWSPEGVEEKEFEKIVNEIAGEPIAFGEGKALNFYDESGRFADPHKTKKALEYAFSGGLVPDAYDSSGAPLNMKNAEKYGRLVPTGENGKYYLTRHALNGVEHYRNEDGTYYTVDLKSLNETYGGKEQTKTNSLYNKIMSGDLF